MVFTPRHFHSSLSVSEMAVFIDIFEVWWCNAAIDKISWFLVFKYHTYKKKNHLWEHKILEYKTKIFLFDLWAVLIKNPDLLGSRHAEAREIAVLEALCFKITMITNYSYTTRLKVL